MEIKNIKNQQQETFIQNLEKGFVVSNGVFVDNKKDISYSIKYNNEVKKIHKEAKKGKWNPASGPLAKKYNLSK